ncbi:MAG: phosphotransferase, partial [Pseudomonadota bacterium]|nr:phosphotransferase [Pseudomonadota bacterium]
LVALRGVELHLMRIDDLAGAIDCHADVLSDSDAGWQYQFRLDHGGTPLAEGRAAVMLQT